MFKKFDEKADVSGVNNVKSSVQRGIRASIIDSYPYIEQYMDQILPKKDPLKAVKCSEHIEIIAGKDGRLLFFKHYDGPWCPTLKLLHKYPFMCPRMQVDKGAIRFILSGANIMCPGLTSPGAKMTKVDKGTVVAVLAEGKTNALAIGFTTKSTEDILSVNKGVGVDNLHYLNDGLWHMKPVK